MFRLAEQTQTPIDLAGCLALAVLAVAASGKVWLQAPGWREPLCLYVVIALPPGNRKSEVYAVMTEPIRAYEDELRELASPSIVKAAMERRMADVDAEKAERDTLGAAGEERQVLKEEAIQKALDAEAIRVPAEPRLYSGNVTVEALSAIMAAQGGRYAVLSPEGELFDIAAGQYSGGRRPNFGILKHGHAGETVRVDRLSREGEDIRNATLTLGICTQPSVLESLADTPEFRGQGLLGRILYSIPQSLLGRRDHRNAEKVPAHIVAEYTSNLTALLRTLHELPDHSDLTLSSMATNAAEDLLDEHEARLHPETGDLAHMADWAAKSVGATLRIAGLLHLAEHVGRGAILPSLSDPITVESIANARETGDYFTHHAQAAYDAMGADPTVGDARAVLAWIKTTGTDRFTARDV
ncbi:DUF3987 domain-containing protein [Actinocorallia sp. API 0066]|uniref:YfjI family protein n=1 Tax=Actinocorallia sp. API 0066 TaxID=2896846 RepID=UPI001E4BCDC6|nr:YfjI family protein [Actinocorallia sp. API 0066]MCD0448329.1 DUF3987 domain-containing protein [Actinocorallia sp. API 0066]